MRMLLACLMLPALVAPLPAADKFIIENGVPRAEIVISESPQRTVRLAAQELRDQLEKITGAKLPIVTKPSGQAIQLLVGRSARTEALKLSTEGLRDGAYRIVSGPDWMAFIGDDTDFTPTAPWARNNGEIASGKLQQEWSRLTGEDWGVPFAGMYKHRLRLPGLTGKPDGAVTEKNETLELWGFDERGSFNAVCGWLQQLGMRWYLPGELGEVVPRLKSIPLPRIDETVHPDFPLRRVNIRPSVVGPETALWSMRLGLRDPYGIQVAHGLATMTGRDAIFAKHPEWFALYGGKRHYSPDSSKNQLCYSNEEVFEHTVRYARAQFDHYPFKTVSIMPPDGYTAICQCPLCQGKDSPERDNRGLLSDHVWDFVNRVAKEVGKTHPDRTILNCAYGVYTLPPQKIEKLEPNVQVCIVGGRRPAADQAEEQAALRKLREDWASKTDNPILIFENYPFTDRGWYLPAYFTGSLEDGINATKGISDGEDIWLSVGRDFDTVGIGFNHFLVYFTARMYWGGPQADIDAMFREYCRLFYGPAEREMLAFFEYCEANWRDMEKEKSKTDTALALFAAAQKKAEPDTLFAKRISLIDDFLKGLRNKSTQLGRIRGPVPKLRLVNEARQPIVIDGKIDDDAWVKAPVASTARLRELQVGGLPVYGTSVKSAWRGNSVYFAIRCDEEPGWKPNVTATRKDDSAIWYGDAVEVLLETESHSYYQIAVNPAGAVADLDRGAPKSAWFNWDAQAEVATHVGDDHWIVEMRIPVTGDENDPLHQVIGKHPRQSLPWHINICRQRIRDDGQELSALSPTGTAGFHDVMKFAHFYDGRSHQFEAAAPDDDFLNAIRIAERLARDGKREEALDAFVKAAERKVTDFQKSYALDQAAMLARGLRRFEAADELASRIPIEAVRLSVRMQNRLEQGEAKQVIDELGTAAIEEWPFWIRGMGYLARGRARMMTAAFKDADEDFSRSLRLTPDARARDKISLLQAQNRERNLRDDQRALEAYERIIGDAGQIGGSDQFSAVEGMARILTRRGDFETALTVINQARPDALQGTWRGALLLSRAETLAAANKRDEAAALYTAISSDSKVETRHRRQAEERLKALKTQQ